MKKVIYLQKMCSLGRMQYIPKQSRYLNVRVRSSNCCAIAYVTLSQKIETQPSRWGCHRWELQKLPIAFCERFGTASSFSTGPSKCTWSKISPKKSLYYVSLDAQSSAFCKWAAIHCRRWNSSALVGYLAVVLTSCRRRNRDWYTNSESKHSSAWALFSKIAKLSVFKSVFVLILISGDSKGGPGWSMPPPDFCLAPCLPPQVFFHNFPFKFVWLTYKVENFRSAIL